ncbi:MAG: hypothetical protein ACRDF4_11080 [Rhabdochlamydiaceae bacterium]
MTAFYCYTILDDANFFINHAKTLPTVPSANPLRARYIRAGVLCSWIALEEVLEFAIEEHDLSKAAPSKPLRNRLDFVLQSLGRKPVEPQAFMEARKLRNDITHPSDRESASLEEAMKTFDFCFSAIKNLSRHGVKLGF